MLKLEEIGRWTSNSVLSLQTFSKSKIIENKKIVKKPPPHPSAFTILLASSFQTFFF